LKGGTKVLDKAELMDRLGGDKNLLAKIAELFEGECDSYVSAIREAIRSSDLKTLESASHALKGMLSNLAAEGATEAALKLENMARSGDLIGAEEALRSLNSHLESLKPAIEELVEDFAG
jgi:two-component system sensor histidine kinase/response regulator